MAQRLKTNTSVTISLGPFVDATDGVTPETALTVANTAVTVVAETDDNSAPTLVLDAVAGSDATNTLAHITNDDAGMYSYKLTNTNLNRLGRIKVIAVGAAHAPVFQAYEIVPAMVYDSDVLGTDVMQADVTQWLGTAAAAPTVAGVPEVDVTHWLGTAAAAPTVAGVPEVDVTHLLGTAWLAPGTAGTPDVNAKLISASTTAADNVETAFATTLAEAAAVPAANAAIWTKLNYLFLKARNKITQTSTTQVVYADDGTTPVATSTVSDNGTTATRGEFA